MAEQSGPAWGLRLSDADRQQALDVLAEHFALGRLTHDEFDERSDAVWSAKTHGDLSPAFFDLPSVDLPGRSPDRSPLDGQRPAGRRGRFGARRLLVPLFVLLLAITILTHLPFVLIAIVIGFLVFSGGRRHWDGRWAHSSGNRFEARGRCW